MEIVALRYFVIGAVALWLISIVAIVIGDDTVDAIVSGLWLVIACAAMGFATTDWWFRLRPILKAFKKNETQP